MTTPVPGIDLALGLLAATVNGRWQPGIGDPTIYGWITVGLYAVGAVLAAVAAKRCTRRRRLLRHPGRERAFWVVTAIAMAVLAVNKQLDLQSWFTHTARDLSREQGWYEHRRDLQMLFIAGLAGATLVLGVAAVWFLRRTSRAAKLALAGLAFLGVFILLRASLFHHVHEVMFRRVPSVNMNVALEWTGIALTAAGAAAALRVRSSAPTPAGAPAG
ncbi:MAG: isopropylmalate isomerase [Phycisphaeraceae bacterium]